MRGPATELDLTVFLVTHDVDEAITLGDRFGFFGGPRGFIQQWVPAQDGATPEQILAHFRGTVDGSGNRVV